MPGLTVCTKHEYKKGNICCQHLLVWLTELCVTNIINNLYVSHTNFSREKGFSRTGTGRKSEQENPQFHCSCLLTRLLALFNESLWYNAICNVYILLKKQEIWLLPILPWGVFSFLSFMYETLWKCTLSLSNRLDHSAQLGI